MYLKQARRCQLTRCLWATLVAIADRKQRTFCGDSTAQHQFHLRSPPRLCWLSLLFQAPWAYFKRAAEGVPDQLLQLFKCPDASDALISALENISTYWLGHNIL